MLTLLLAMGVALAQQPVVEPEAHAGEPTEVHTEDGAAPVTDDHHDAGAEHPEALEPDEALAVPEAQPEVPAAVAEPADDTHGDEATPDEAHADPAPEPPQPAELVAIPAADGHGDDTHRDGAHGETAPTTPSEASHGDAPHVEQATPEPAPAPAPAPRSSSDLLPFPFDFGWTSPQPATPAPTQVHVQAAETPWANYVLPLPQRGFGTALRLLVWVLFALFAELQLNRLRRRLLRTGVLPAALTLGAQALRLVAMFGGVLVLAALLPESMLPVLPIAMLGGALAIGVSVWTVLPDVWSGVLLSVEQRLLPGQWIRTGDLSGEVEQVGLRATQIVDRHGGRILIPNRHLTAEAFTAEEVRWPPVDIAVPVPPELSAEEARALLNEAVMLSPFLAPNSDAALVQEQFAPPIWRVRARIVEAHWADEFEGALRERVRELLEAR
ncbi:MAG: mechanosensitive ion channel [Deltaproteobacteria bacterium]|nr:MAG: mechanosensitive ion channel [Deltaproteobacteria bacterium]